MLAQYVGWGGLADCFDERHSKYAELKALLTEDEYAAARESTLTAFYTPPVVIRSIYQALTNMGFQTGNLLEPSCGIGNFIGMRPEALADSKIYGVELDGISGRIAQQLYQQSSIAVQGFEKTDLPDSFFDAAIGNVPFGSFKVIDKRYDRYNFLIHDYFFARTLDKVRVRAASSPLLPAKARWTRTPPPCGSTLPSAPTCWGPFVCPTTPSRTPRARM